MRKFSLKKLFYPLVYLLCLFAPALAYAAITPTILVDPKALGFKIPGLSDVLTFLIRFFFVVAGLAALLYLLWGSLSWVLSGGNKENVEKARDKIQAAIVGVILIVIVVAIVATLEQIVFAGHLCFGLTCAITIPSLLQ